MSIEPDEFAAYRARMNERILEEDNQVIRRFFALDQQAYRAGSLPVKVKELLGLVASLVLRCDDCVRYHLLRSREAGPLATSYSRPSRSDWSSAARSSFPICGGRWIFSTVLSRPRHPGEAMLAALAIAPDQKVQPHRIELDHGADSAKVE